VRAVIQRVSKASVQVDGDNLSGIGKGLMVLLGVEEDDNQEDAQYMAEKIVALRIFEDEDEKMNKSLTDIDGELLIVSQFTLLGDARKGRRPSFIKAAPAEKALELYDTVVKICSGKVKKVAIGQFQAHMSVKILNDGPVTILLDSKKLF